MLTTIRQLLGLSPEAAHAAATDGDGFSHEAKVAATALLYRMVAADFEVHDEETQELAASVRRLLDVPAEQAQELLAEAEREARESVSLYDFTSVLHRQLDPQRKIEIVEILWRVAFADGELDPQEEYLVRKVAGLLHVPHAEFIAAKQRAREAEL